MSLFLSVTAFLLSAAAIAIGVAALRRIDGQNQEFLTAYVQEIRNDLLAKDRQIATMRRELAAVRTNRSVSRDALRSLENESSRKRKTATKAEQHEENGLFLPSLERPNKRSVA